MDGIVPLNGCVLVELSEAYANVATPDKQYSTKTSGIVRKMDATDSDHDYTGKRVWFEEYKDGVQVQIDGKDHAFIKFEEIRGYGE